MFATDRRRNVRPGAARQWCLMNGKETGRRRSLTHVESRSEKRLRVRERWWCVRASSWRLVTVARFKILKHSAPGPPDSKEEKRAQ